MERQSRVDQGRSLGAARFALIAAFALGIVMLHDTSTTFPGTHNRITSISPPCASPGERVTLRGFGLGAANIVVTVAGIRARVVHATGHLATFIVPASAPDGPTIVEVSHKVGGHRGWPGKKVIGSIAFQVGCDQTNQPPVARAGPDQDVTVGDLVSLDGRNSSDPDGDLITYLWTVVATPAGSIAALDSTTSVTPVLSPDLPGAYRIALVVNDGQLDSLPDEVLIQAAPPNVPPTANAGMDRSVVTGSLVNLDGTGSFDPDGDPLSYVWLILSKPGGSNAALNDPASPTPSFPADQNGQYLIQLVVHDGEANSSPDDVVVIAAFSNAPPIADAGGDQTVARNATIQLDGSHSSDPNGDPLSHSWSVVSRPAGSASPFNDANTATPSLFADRGGEYVFRLVVNDGQMDSTPDTVLVTVVNDSPTANAGPDQAVAPRALVTLDGSGSTDPNGDSLTYFWSIVSSPAGSAAALNLPASIHPTITPDLPGVYSISLTVSDGQATSSPDTVDITASVPTVVVPDVVGLAQADAEAAIVAAGLSVGGISTANSDTVVAGSVISQSPAGGSSVAPVTTVSLVVSLGSSGPGLPPDPSTVAPPVDQTVATTIGESTAFLYTGANSIQTGVAPGTIDPKRAAVIRGKVLTREGTALPAVQISVKDHPEFGQTLSRADGMFDLAVNGGGTLTVNYAKTGFLAAQRQINVPWQDYAALADVVMVALDAQVSTIAANAPAVQVHQAAPVTDGDGTRQAVLLFPAGVTAQMVLPNGTTQPLASLSVRATEYTVGANGPKAMPAPLPPTSAYTYAVELSVDEAVAAGATTVTFDRPVPNYVDNFLNFPVGMAVPTAYYDRVKAAWVPSENGRIIRITGVTDGLADVDSVGSRALSPLVLDDAERRQLATLYPVGRELWRVPVSHFTPWDHNWPYAPPADAGPPPGQRSDEEDEEERCLEGGSIIECQNQIVGQSVAVVGTPFRLNYRSDRTTGRAAANTVAITLSGANVPASLERIDLKLQVAGRTLEQSFPAAPNQTTMFSWDGLDAFGRALQGRQPVTGSLDYVYRGVYTEPAAFDSAFSSFGTAVISGSRTRKEITVSQSFSKRVGTIDARPIGLGGWTLSPHHTYDPVGQRLYLGDGSRRGGDDLVLGGIRTVAGGGNNQSWQPGTPATEARLGNPAGIAIGPDNSIFLVETRGDRVLRVGPDGSLSVVAGGGSNDGDGIPATESNLWEPYDVAIGPDGSLNISDSGRGIVRRVDPAGIITTVAGTGLYPAVFNGDGIPATQANLYNPTGLAIGPDGSLYISESNAGRIRRVDPAGIITTVAGTGVEGFSGDGGPATQAQIDTPIGIAVAADGSLYFGDVGNRRLRRVSPEGIISSVAGSGNPTLDSTISDIAIGPDGSLYIAEGEHGRVRRVDPSGMITTVAGATGGWEFNGDGIPATQAILASPENIAIGPDGTLYISDIDQDRVRNIRSVFPGLSAGTIAIASENGRLLYQFDAVGRHERTLDTLTGVPLHELTYDSAGRLAGVIEKTGGTDKVTTIAHDSNGHPTVIVGPFGQQTLLTTDANGYLASIANPAGETVQITSSSTGLLQTFTDPRGKTSHYAYDAQGRLTQATNPDGGTQSFGRTELDNGYAVTRTTALGRATTYQVERLANGDHKMTNTSPGGQSRMVLSRSDGTDVFTQAGGLVTTFVRGPDPRFGMLAPVEGSGSVTLPGGPTYATSTTESAVLSDPADVFSLAELTTTSLANGRPWTTTYTGATKTYSTVTPTGRTTTDVIDARGRLLATQAAGMAAKTYAYDGFGRLEAVVRGSGTDARTATLTYDPQGFLAAVTDAIGRSTNFAHDQAGRLTTKTLANGEIVAFGYDAAGNLVSVTAPNGNSYTFGYSDKGRLNLVSPPAVPGTGMTAYSFNLDGQLAEISLPDNRTITLGYNSSGRLTTRALSANGSTTATDSLAYDAEGRLASITAAGGVTTTYGYLGAFLRDEAWTGPVSGSVTRTYDANLWRASQSVNGVDPIGFTYDNDGLLTGAGNLVLARDAQTGLPIGSSLGIVQTNSGHNAFGELTSFAATVGGSSVFSIDLTRNNIAHVLQRTETVGGSTQTLVYEYDSVGQLISVTRDGVETERYTYDANGNRIGATVRGRNITAVYDDQDRLASYGATVYTYDGAGTLVSKSEGGQTTTYQYDALGNLLRVTLPDGRVVEYVVDGLGRRVGKRVNGTLTQGFLYSGKRIPVAELDGANTVLSRFVVTGRGAPAYMIRGGTTYRIVTDEIGSVRLVVNAQTGDVAQRLDYDSFGNITQDTNPGFQPFGFAGGLYDPDTGLVRFGRRDYDASSGRWTAKEPSWVFRGETNLYRYAHNNPVNRVDRNGLEDDPIPQLPSESDYCQCGGSGTTAQCLPASGAVGEWVDRLENNLENVGGGNPGAAFGFACVMRDVADAVIFHNTERAWQQGMCRTGGNEGECFEDDEQSLGEPAPPPPPEAHRGSGRSSQPPLPPCIVEDGMIRRPEITDIL